MEEGKTINVSAGARLAQGKLEPQLQVVSQAAAGVRMTGKENSRTDIMVTDPSTKKNFTQELGSVSPPPKETKAKEKKNKVMIIIITWKYHGNEEIMRMAGKKKYGKVEKLKMDEENTINPRQIFYIKYEQNEEVSKIMLRMKEDNRIAETTAVEEQRIDMTGAVDEEYINKTPNTTQRTRTKKPARWILL